MEKNNGEEKRRVNSREEGQEFLGKDVSMTTRGWERVRVSGGGEGKKWL